MLLGNLQFCSFKYLMNARQSRQLAFNLVMLSLTTRLLSSRILIRVGDEDLLVVKSRGLEDLSSSS